MVAYGSQLWPMGANHGHWSQPWPMGANRGLWEPIVANGSQPWPMEPIMASQAHQMGLPVPPQCQIVILETPSAPPVPHRPPQCQIVILETPQCLLSAKW